MYRADLPEPRRTDPWPPLGHSLDRFQRTVFRVVYAATTAYNRIGWRRVPSVAVPWLTPWERYLSGAVERPMRGVLVCPPARLDRSDPAHAARVLANASRWIAARRDAYPNQPMGVVVEETSFGPYDPRRPVDEIGALVTRPAGRACRVPLDPAAGEAAVAHALETAREVPLAEAAASGPCQVVLDLAGISTSSWSTYAVAPGPWLGVTTGPGDRVLVSVDHLVLDGFAALETARALAAGLPEADDEALVPEAEDRPLLPWTSPLPAIPFPRLLRVFGRALSAAGLGVRGNPTTLVPVVPFQPVPAGDWRRERVAVALAALRHGEGELDDDALRDLLVESKHGGGVFQHLFTTMNAPSVPRRLQRASNRLLAAFPPTRDLITLYGASGLVSMIENDAPTGSHAPLYFGTVPPQLGGFLLSITRVKPADGGPPLLHGALAGHGPGFRERPALVRFRDSLRRMLDDASA